MSHSLDEIREVELQLQQAMVNNDVQALERLIHDDLVFIDVEGNVQGKRDDIASHASGAVVQTAVEFVEEPVMQLHGENAIVAVKAYVKVQLQGKPVEAHCRYLRVWLFQDERWQIISGAVRILSIRGGSLCKHRLPPRCLFRAKCFCWKSTSSLSRVHWLFWPMNYTMILTDKPSDLSLTNNVSGWDKLAGKSQMYSLQVIREAAFPVLLQKLTEEYTGQGGPRSCWA